MSSENPYNLNDEEWAWLKGISKTIRPLTYVVLAMFAATYITVYGLPEWMQSAEEPAQSLAVVDSDAIENGIHLPTGFIAEEGYELVAQQCTGCHSAKLITQNRATKDGWIEIIRWMQETQALWDLGVNEEAIVSYLAKHYAPDSTGRRKPLVIEEWYEIED